MKATIEAATYLPSFETTQGDGAKWAIIFHTSSGREEFGRYTTKAAARADAVRYDIRLSE